jgi:hypothetical protein
MNNTKNKYAEIRKNYKQLNMNDPDSILSALNKKPLSPTYKKLIICAFYDEYKNLNGNIGNIQNKYKQIILKILKITQKKEHSHTNRFKKINLDNIKKKIDLMDPTLADINMVILALYCYNPPRRIQDYSVMKYVQNLTDIQKNNFNYYVDNDNIFYFQYYKTFKTFGIQKIKLNEKLSLIIKNYIKNENILPFHALLRYKKIGKDSYSKATLSYYIKKLFNGGSANSIRHSFISQLYINSPYNLFNIDKISTLMAHNVSTHLSYMDKDFI